MEVETNNHDIYLIGEREDNNTFWCWREYSSYDDALSYWLEASDKYSNLRLEIIKKVVTHHVVASTGNLELIERIKNRNLN